MKKIAYLKDFWIFLLVIPYFVVVLKNAQNIPIMDDYDAILGFLTEWKNAAFIQKLSLLLLQANEHRILFSRLVYVLYYGLFGNINFRNLIILADLQLVVIAAIAVYFVRKYSGKYWRVIAFLWVLCIFDLNTFESGSIAMYGMQCYSVIMLFFLSLFFYDRSRKWLAAAALLEALCIFSSGNGMIGAFFIIIYTLRSGDSRKKIVSIATALVCIAIYFVHYNIVEQPGKLPFDMGVVIVFFIKMSGAPINFNYSLALGVLILALLILSLVKNPLKAPWAILCILGFVLASMATSALFRANIKGAQFQTSRYLIYPQLLLAILCLLGWLKLENKKYKWIALTFIMVGMLRIYSGNFEFGKVGFERTAARAITWLYWYPNPKLAKKISDGSCRSGIYCLKAERDNLLSSNE
jgi:hypothetical protein